jgi:RNA recognition motif-containing protein
MSTKLFVARLSFDTTNDSFQKLFEQYGAVISARIVVDRSTAQSKGFGFVEMTNAEEAKAAIQALNDTTFEGRSIAVSVARPQTSVPQDSNRRQNANHGPRDDFRRR